MKVIYRGTHWIRVWLAFQKEDRHKVLKNACCQLETLTMEIFTKHGWI
jgi:hypothetical protein